MEIQQGAICTQAPNGARLRHQFLFDTHVIVGAAAIGDSYNLFDLSANQKGSHLTNMPGNGELPQGHEFLVHAITMQFVGTALADIQQYEKYMLFDFFVNDRKELEAQKCSFFPAQGGAYGIEGVSGGTVNGVPAYSSIFVLPEDKRIYIPPKVSFGGRLYKGKVGTISGAIAATTANTAATGVWEIFGLLGDWNRP